MFCSNGVVCGPIDLLLCVREGVSRNQGMEERFKFLKCVCMGPGISQGSGQVNLINDLGNTRVRDTFGDFAELVQVNRNSQHAGSNVAEACPDI